jgi:hypothetical protein
VAWPGAHVALGSLYRAATNAGNFVGVWVPDEKVGGFPIPWNQCFFCHGHALQTYYDFGYTILSGMTHLGRVLADEWQEVGGAPPAAAVGDIVGWYQNIAAAGVMGFLGGLFGAGVATPVHSDLVVATGPLTLSTKNGANPVQRSTLAEVSAVYPAANVQRVYRRNVPYGGQNRGF